jgi:hypothetical protein
LLGKERLETRSASIQATKGHCQRQQQLNSQ